MAKPRKKVGARRSVSGQSSGSKRSSLGVMSNQDRLEGEQDSSIYMQQKTDRFQLIYPLTLIVECRMRNTPENTRETTSFDEATLANPVIRYFESIPDKEAKGAVTVAAASLIGPVQALVRTSTFSDFRKLLCSQHLKWGDLLCRALPLPPTLYPLCGLLDLMSEFEYAFDETSTDDYCDPYVGSSLVPNLRRSDFTRPLPPRIFAYEDPQTRAVEKLLMS